MGDGTLCSGDGRGLPPAGDAAVAVETLLVSHVKQEIIGRASGCHSHRRGFPYSRRGMLLFPRCGPSSALPAIQDPDQNQSSESEAEWQVRTTRDVIFLFSFLRTRCIAGKKTVELLTYTGIKRRAQTEFNRSAAALRCQCSFAKSVRDPFGITFPAFVLQPGKTLIGTVQKGLLSSSIFRAETSGLWAQQLRLFQLKASSIREHHLGWKPK